MPGKAQARTGGDGTPATFHGGRVTHGTTTYAIFWSPPGFPTRGDHEAAIVKYFQDVAAASGSPTSSYAVATQYFDDTGPGSTQSTFGGALVVTDPAPASECTSPSIESQADPVRLCVLQHTLISLVERTAEANGIDPGFRAVFFVFTPPGMGTCWENGVTCSYAAFAAYHSITDSGYLFAVHPAFFEAPLNGIAHEHIEVMTDPDGTGWYSDGPSDGEIADLCELDPLTPQVLNGTTYSLPPEWSNATGSCASQAPPPTVPLTLATKGPGTGQVRAVFAHQTLTCKSIRRNDSCRTAVRRGERVALKAEGDDGFVFTGWDTTTPCTNKQAATCSFTAGSATANARARFAAGVSGKFLLSIDVIGKGTVVWPDGRKCSHSCVREYAGGTAVALRAVPAKGWRLKRFVDDTRSCRPKLRCTIKVRDNDNVFVTFVRA
jgi:hypothetical protein